MDGTTGTSGSNRRWNAVGLKGTADLEILFGDFDFGPKPWLCLPCSLPACKIPDSSALSRE